MEQIPYLGDTLHRWQVGNSTFLALPERGARLMNWSLTLGDGSVRDIIFWPELAGLDNFARVRGGNPILFPFAGRSFDAGAIHHWRTPDGRHLPMPMHGLARQGRFRTGWLDARGFSAQFEPDAEAANCYPFEYEFVVTYRFEALGLSCELLLSNLGSVPLPWCAGHHFYFTLPWTEGARREDYLIRLPAAEHLRHDPTGQLVPAPTLSPDSSLADPALVDTIHLRLRDSEVVFGERGKPGDIHLRIGTSRRPPPDVAVVTWTESPAAPFYCIEPWMGPPAAALHGRGLQLIPPGQSGKFTVSLAIR